jgi:hypothetical protein
MSQPVKIVVQDKAFMKAIQAYKMYGKKTWKQVFTKASKELAAKIVRVTPPYDVRGGEIENDSEAKKRGQDTIAADLSRLFTTSFDTLRENNVLVRPSKAEIASNSNAATMKSLHKQSKNRRGRIPKSYKARILVKKMAMAKYLRSVQRKVGYLSAGWARGAALTNARIPSWVKRHNSPSQAKISITDDRLVAVFKNNVPFARYSALQNRVDFALNRQASAMMKQVANFAKKRVVL